jgi:hypothetical protein
MTWRRVVEIGNLGITHGELALYLMVALLVVWLISCRQSRR